MMEGWVPTNSKSVVELMQNCDLPPPVKIFTGTDESILSSMNRIFNNMVVEEEVENDELNGTENEKLELLKALRLSQTRAREAEKRAAVFRRERDVLRNALVEDSSKLFSYRQWVKLLELQLLRVQMQQKKGHGFCKAEDDEGVGGMSWFVGWILCLGIAGVGFTFGCRYFL